MMIAMEIAQITSTYFSDKELTGKVKTTIPIILNTSNYSVLARAVAHSKYRCCLVINKDKRFINIVTQGDVLRFTEKLSMKDCLTSDVLKVKKKPLVALNSAQSKEIIDINGVSVIPLVNTQYHLIGVSLLDNNPSINSQKVDNLRIGLVMSGGKGKRLYPLTKEIPKPLLPLGHQSVLEHVLDSLNHVGIEKYILMTGHLSEKFIEFQEKSARQLSVFVEDNPLGTGGPLLKWFFDDHVKINSYIKQYGSFTLLVCNGDLIFDIPNKIISDFEDSEDSITLIARNNFHPIKFGVLSIDNESYLSSFKEKPIYEFLVNTGIYLFKIDQSFLKIIDNYKINKIDMPDLLLSLEKNHGLKVKVAEIHGNYIDVGTKEDLIEVSAFFKEK